jgi:hypothetical protein
MVWKFQDPPNLAVIIDRRIIEKRDWIASVFHELDDGGWQFHTISPEPLDVSDGMIVSLQSMVRRDESISELADLPLGWRAWREAKDLPWQRAKIIEIDSP